MIRARHPRIAALAVLFLAMAGGSAGAAEYQVRAYVQPDRGITDGRPVQLVIEVEGATSPQVTPPRLNGLENLQILGGPSTNSSFTWRNGQASSQYKLIYTLLAEKPGTARIPALELTVDSRVYRTVPIELEVEKAPSGPAPTPPPARARPQAGEDTYDVFLRAELGSEEVWVGEPTLLSVTLYTSQRIARWDRLQAPSLGEFWKESIEVDPAAEGYRTRIQGRSYTAYPLVRELLIPPTPGTFKIEPYVAQMQMRLQSRDDLFDIFSFGRTQPVVRKSDPLELRVRQLPGGKPDGFGGAVGDYTLRVSLDREEAAANEAVALRATVEGDGLLRAVEPPAFDPPPDLKVFEPKITGSTRSTRGGISSKTTWEWIVVPLAPGELQLPELSFPYFNPTKAEYEVTRAAPPPLTVTKGEPAEESPRAHGDIQLQRRDLAFIKPLRGKLSGARTRVHRRSFFVGLLAAPVVLVPLAILLGRRRARLRQDLGLARGRRAGSRARKRLRSVGKRMTQMESAAFHEEVARTLVEYAADRFNRHPAGLTYDLADELLGSSGVRPELRRRFRATLETCDFARYVPAAAKNERRAEVLREASTVLDELERA